MSMVTHTKVCHFVLEFFLNLFSFKGKADWLVIAD